MKDKGGLIMEQHRHCTKCGEIIEKPGIREISYYRNMYYELRACEKCLIKIGIDKVVKAKYGKK